MNFSEDIEFVVEMMVVEFIEDLYLNKNVEDDCVELEFFVFNRGVVI